jgi:UDP-2,4-diacetamido-2,4,6-trideoxy-beta-L-altropyranose hydrolase
VKLVGRDLGLQLATQPLDATVRFELLAPPPPSICHEVLTDPVPHAPWAALPWSADASEFIARIKEWSPDLVIVDHYSFDARWHDLVQQALHCKLAVIDDLADRTLHGDILVDHNYSESHRLKYSGLWSPNLPLLGGPRYALLSTAYQCTPKHVVRRDVSRIGIFMGGVDAHNHSALAHAACRELARFRGYIEIAATSSNPHIETLRKICANDSLTSLRVDLPNLAGFFAQSDLQIGAGGGATWERCCVGVPTISVVTADNQRIVVDSLSANSAVVGAECTKESIGRAVSELLESPERRAALSARARLLVDGLGAKRVALRLCRESLHVRKATKSDGAVMYAWRNHEATRLVSNDTEAISLGQHLEWLDRSLSDPNRTLLVAAVGEINVGVIRFDHVESDAFRVSLYLDPSLHGIGLGPQMLVAGEHCIGPGVRFIAHVKATNRPSQRTFGALGYVQREPELWIKEKQ